MPFTKQFLSLIEEKQNEAVKLILQDGRLHHSVDATGATLLHHAARHGNVDLTKHLLSNGCDIDARNAEGYTPLMSAVARRRDTIMEILLAAGADIDVENYFFETALNVALDLHPSSPTTVQILFRALRKEHSSEEIAEKLIDDEHNLEEAVLLRDARIIEHMLDNGVSIECSHDEDNFPLHRAVDLADAEIVKVLLKYGADCEALNHVGATPVHLLYHLNLEDNRERLDILRMLLSRGVSLTTCMIDGHFQVWPTLTRGSDEAVRLVLQSGIDFTARNERTGMTILHYLILNGNRGMAEVLNRHIDGFDIDATDAWGRRPLQLAVKSGNVNMVKLLLDRGADVSEVLFCAFSPAVLRFKDPHDQCTELLLQHNADPQEVRTGKDGQRRTIFDVFTEGNHLDRMEFALARLAVDEEKGTTVTELTRAKINSRTRFSRYFEKCRNLLRKNIAGSVSIFELLTADDKKMAKYLNNHELALKLARIDHKKELKSTHWYYYSTMKKKFTKGMVMKYLRHRAADVIRHISKNRLGLRDIPTDVIIDYFSDADLRRSPMTQSKLLCH